MTSAESQPPKADVSADIDFESHRMAALQSAVTEAQKQRKIDEETRLERERQLADAWKQRAEESQTIAREDRHRRLAALSCCSSSKCPPNLELTEAGEYASLMEKYGHKIRVALPALPGLDSASVMSASEQTSMHLPRKPPVPKSRHPAGDNLKAFRRQIRAIRKQKQQSEEQDSTSNAEHGTGQKTQRTPMAPTAASSAQVALPTTSLPPVAEHSRSLMPKKESLRRRQKALLKKTPVVFYRLEMKEHMEKILAAVELTF